MARIELGGVDTWYEERGAGEPLVLLHPGGADARAWGPSVGPLAGRFRVFTPERRGQGRTPDVEGPITYEAMVDDTIAFLEEVVGGPADLVGWSAGAAVALLTALRRPDLAGRVVLVSGVFHRDGWIPAAIDPGIEPHPAIARGHAELSPDGADHFPIVAAKLRRMDHEEPTLAAVDLQGLAVRTLVMVGDDDEVTLGHAVAMYGALPDGELAIVPGTSHGLLHEKPELCNRLILDFLTTDPVETIAPVRRAGRSSPASRATMLEGADVATRLPAQDLGRARAFYSEKLGLEPSEERPGGLRYRCGDGEFALFESAGAAAGTHTQMGWQVEDVEATVARLRENGVVFEEYELPGLTTRDGIAEVDGNYPSKGVGERAAWFRDSEGNLLAIGQAVSGG